MVSSSLSFPLPASELNSPFPSHPSLPFPSPTLLRFIWDSPMYVKSSYPLLQDFHPSAAPSQHPAETKANQTRSQTNKVSFALDLPFGREGGRDGRRTESTVERTTEPNIYSVLGDLLGCIHANGSRREGQHPCLLACGSSFSFLPWLSFLCAARAGMGGQNEP